MTTPPPFSYRATGREAADTSNEAGLARLVSIGSLTKPSRSNGWGRSSPHPGTLISSSLPLVQDVGAVNGGALAQRAGAGIGQVGAVASRDPDPGRQFLQEANAGRRSVNSSSTADRPVLDELGRIGPTLNKVILDASRRA